MPLETITNTIYLRIPVLLPLPLPIGLGGIIPILNNQILRPIIKSPREVRIQNILRPLRVSLLRINRRAGHVRHHRIAAALGVLGIAKGVVLGCGLREPDVAAVAA